MLVRYANKTSAAVRLTDFKIKASSVVPGKGSPLSRAIRETGEIRLAHDQHVFSFNLANVEAAFDLIPDLVIAEVMMPQLAGRLPSVRNLEKR